MIKSNTEYWELRIKVGEFVDTHVATLRDAIAETSTDILG